MDTTGRNRGVGGRHQAQPPEWSVVHRLEHPKVEVVRGLDLVRGSGRLAGFSVSLISAGMLAPDRA